MPAEFICIIDGAQAETNQESPPTSVVSVILTDTNGAFTKTAFPIPDEAKREILAVALAAITNQARVLAVLDPSAQVSRRCYLLQLFVD